MRAALRHHWPEYLMEAAGLGLFMVSACGFALLLYHPGSPLVQVCPAEFPRRILIGLAMGLTAVAIIYSPWGQQSGAHLNPAVTLTFLRLGKVAPWDALFYIIAQFAGGVGGVAVVAALAGGLLTHPAVNYVVTVPGPAGAGAAFLAEAGISFVLMLVVLLVSNRPQLARFTGCFAGLCVAAFITVESPWSGMSMNPARTLASALWPRLWDSIWIYFVAPPVGMLAAAAVYQACKLRIACAKLQHQNGRRCIFCEHQSTARKAANLQAPLVAELPPGQSTGPTHSL